MCNSNCAFNFFDLSKYTKKIAYSELVTNRRYVCLLQYLLELIMPLYYCVLVENLETHLHRKITDSKFI